MRVPAPPPARSRTLAARLRYMYRSSSFVPVHSSESSSSQWGILLSKPPFPPHQAVLV